MSRIGLGYGSEWHILRFLGRHRQSWNAAIIDLLSDDGVREVTDLNWRDFPFSAKAKTGDQEIKGMDFLVEEHWAKWKSFWPDPLVPRVDRDGIHTWDAVGQVFGADAPEGEWLLVEAKSHERELVASPACGASGNSLATITSALEQTFLALGCQQADWERGCRNAWLAAGNYQIANRLAALYFLRNIVHQPARLLFVYFLNDCIEGKRCPTNAMHWARPLARMYEEMGILFSHAFEPFVHYLCVDTTDGQRSTLNIQDADPRP